MRKIAWMLLVFTLFVSLCSCEAIDSFIDIDRLKQNIGMSTDTNESNQISENENKDNSYSENNDVLSKNPTYGDKIDPNEEYEIIFYGITSYRMQEPPTEWTVIKNNEVWGDQGGYLKGRIYYADDISIEYNESVTQFIKERKERDEFYTWLDDCLETIQENRGFYMFNAEEGLEYGSRYDFTGVNALFRFGDNFLILNGEMNGDNRLFVGMVYQGEVNPEIEFNLRFTEKIDITDEINISAESIVSKFSDEINKTVDIKIKNGELWDESGERFYGNISYEEYGFMNIQLSNYLSNKRYIYQNETKDREHSQLISSLCSYRGVYYSYTELSDSPLGRACIICFTEDSVYILSGTRTECCSCFYIDNIYHASLQSE